MQQSTRPNPLAARSGNRISGYLICRNHQNKMRWQYSYYFDKKHHTYWVPDDLAESIASAIVAVAPAKRITEQILGKVYKGV